MQGMVRVAVVGFALGIALRSVASAGLMASALFGVLALATFILIRAQFVSRSWGWYVLVALLSVSIGIARMDMAVPATTLSYPFGTEVSFEAVVVREPDVRERYTNLVVASDDFSGRILVRAERFDKYAYADVLQVQGVLERVENFEGDTGRIFNYQGYLAKDRIYAIVASPQITKREENVTPTGLLLRAKSAYLASLKRVLPEPFAALGGGITVGERRSLGESLTQAFRDTGLIHIVVLSGYNITIIAVFIASVLGFLPRKGKHIGAIIGIVAFTILVGASATVVRAAIMGSIGALGIFAGRTSNVLHALTLAAGAMLLWNPYVLVYDPSFQLSFVATLGLIIGTPLITPYLSFVTERFLLRDIVAATVSTQIAVLPLLAYMVGSVSLVSLPVNVLVLPLVPLAMLAVFVAGVVGIVHTAFALPFAYLAYGLLWYVFKIVEFFAALPFAATSVPVFSMWFVGIAYVLLGLGVLYKKKKATPGLRNAGESPMWSTSSRTG